MMRRLLVLSMIGILCTISQGAQKRRFQRQTATVAQPNTAPLLQNWDFETGPFNTVGMVTGWIVGCEGCTYSPDGHVGNVSFEGGTTGTHAAALSAGGDSQGDSLSQSFPTTPGTTYVLDFDSGIYNVTESSLQLRIQVYSNPNSLVLDQLVNPPRNVNNPEQTPFQHYHFTFTADSNSTTLRFIDLLLDNQNADIVVDSVSVAPVPPTYAEWQSAHFTAGQLGDQQICGWSADPDADGIGNGFEYYFNNDPMAGVTTTDVACLPRITIEGPPSAQYLTCTFRRLLGWPGNDIAVDVSDDLMSWDTSGDQVEDAANPIPSGDGVTEVAKVHLKTVINQAPGITRKFMRLRLSQ